MDTKERNIVFKALVGSRAYGTNVEGSDYDFKGVYIANKYEVLTGTFPEQISTSKDETYYEVSRFLQLLALGNPTMIELLFTPKDCVRDHESVMDLIFKHRDKFLTKKLANSFCGYAYAQIVKAKGLDKKMNWEAERIERKTPRDFCYVLHEASGKSYKFTEYFTPEQQELYAVTKADHAADTYFLYKKEDCLSFFPLDSDNSNSLKCSSVKKDVKGIHTLHFNKSEYTKHCADYKSYRKWLNERNTQRYVDIENHGQQIDGKNMLHCIRLIDMGLEIARGEGCNVRRPNSEYLKSIRHGKVDLETLLKEAEDKLEAVKESFKTSSLPENVDQKFINDLLFEIREQYINL